MKITINVEPLAAETSLLVTCKELTPQVEKLLAAIRILDKQITANKGDAVCLINLADVFYIEALERKTFIYTDKEVFDSEMKLYELEAALAQYNFIRVSDSKLPWLLTALAFVLSFSCTIIITTLLEKRMMTK